VLDHADLSAQVRTAHADAWQVQGRLRSTSGGGCAELPGIRLMASGLPHPQWNTGDVDDAARVDLAQVEDWYRRLGMPWGVRVAIGTPWVHGQHVARQRLMGRLRDGFTSLPDVDGVTIRAARPDDLDRVASVDARAFGGEPDAAAPWLAPLLDAADATVALVETAAGKAVGTAYAVRSDGRAGPAVYLAGVAVVPEARRRGIGAAVSGWLLRDGFARGARLAHLQPDDDRAARVYARLGFVEVEGLDVYVVQDAVPHGEQDAIDGG